MGAEKRRGYVYAWRNGEIGFGCVQPPKGVLVLGRGILEELTDAVSAMAGHAKDGRRFLVPGVPEARDKDEALEALIKFHARLQVHMHAPQGKAR